MSSTPGRRAAPARQRGEVHVDAGLEQRLREPSGRFRERHHLVVVRLMRLVVGQVRLVAGPEQHVRQRLRGVQLEVEVPVVDDALDGDGRVRDDRLDALPGPHLVRVLDGDAGPDRCFERRAGADRQVRDRHEIGLDIAEKVRLVWVLALVGLPGLERLRREAGADHELELVLLHVQHREVAEEQRLLAGHHESVLGRLVGDGAVGLHARHSLHVPHGPPWVRHPAADSAIDCHRCGDPTCGQGSRASTR